MTKNILNNFIKLFNRNNEYNSIKYRNFDGDNQEYIKYIAEGNNLVREVPQATHLLIGRFFTIVLYTEYKLVKLLSGYDKRISAKMLGSKIKVFKSFINDFDFTGTELNKEYFTAIIQGLMELKTIRNNIAHDLNKIHFDSRNIKQMLSCVKKINPHFLDGADLCTDENELNMIKVSAFAITVSHEISRLRIWIK